MCVCVWQKLYAIFYLPIILNLQQQKILQQIAYASLAIEVIWFCCSINNSLFFGMPTRWCFILRGLVLVQSLTLTLTICTSHNTKLLGGVVARVESQRYQKLDNADGCHILILQIASAFSTCTCYWSTCTNTSPN